jgi:hypothetical protein
MYYFLMHKDMYFCCDNIKNITKCYNSTFLKVVIYDSQSQIAGDKLVFSALFDIVKCSHPENIHLVIRNFPVPLQNNLKDICNEKVFRPEE